LNNIGSGSVYMSSGTTPSAAASNPAAEARQANEDRYQQLLDLYTSLRDRTMAGVEGLGTAGRSRIDRMQAQGAAAARASAASRGLSGTTVPDVMVAGVGRDAEIARQELEDRLMERRLGYDVALTQGLGNVIEGRTDEYPNAEAYAQYAYQGAVADAARPQQTSSPFDSPLGAYADPDFRGVSEDPEIIRGSGPASTPSYIDERTFRPSYPVYQWG
jgi:hypothetical protein